MLSARPLAIIVTTLTGTVLFTGCGADATRPVRPLYLGAATDPRPPTGPLTIATDLPGERREVILDAQERRTSLGHFRKGDHVEIQAIAGKWTYQQGAELVGANGLQTTCVAPSPHVCAAGDGRAPGMGLMLYEVPSPEPAKCAPSHRFFIPNGVEMEMPESRHVFLAPNDIESEMADNRGSIRVQVDLSPSKTAPVFQTQKIEVRANSPRTSIGTLRAGTYIRVTVEGGTWQHATVAGDTHAEGDPKTMCMSEGLDRCAGGEGVPRMGLVFLMSQCPDGGVPTLGGEERKTFIGAGKFTTTFHEDTDLFAGPNDWEDGCHDNAGALTLEVITKRALL